MTRAVAIAPSLLSADFAHLGAEIEALTRAGADMIHLDVMDGSFVQNLTFGPPVIAALRPFSNLPFDTHLMVKNPRDLFPSFQKAGCNGLTIHPEATDTLQDDLVAIRALGLRAGVALNPQTPIDLITPSLAEGIDLILIMTVQAGLGGQPFQPLYSKIRAAREWIENSGHRIDLQVDGGITTENAGQIIDAGADILVSGTFIFAKGPKGYTSAISALKGL